MSENVPLVLCVAAIWVAWSVHDYLQEAIFLTPGTFLWSCVVFEICVVRIHFTGL